MSPYPLTAQGWSFVLAQFGSFVCDAHELEAGWPWHPLPNPITTLQLPRCVPLLLVMDLMTSSHQIKDTL